MSRQLFGREVIYTDTKNITRDNVVAILNDILPVFNKNSSDIQYLYNYRRGKQPIWERVKTFRDDICNKVVVNRANEIAEFKVGYLIGEPVQYVNRGLENTADDVSMLNSIMFGENKAAKDKELVDWAVTGGVGYRLVLPKEDYANTDGECVDIYTLDPRSTFVVRYNGLGNEVVMGGTVTTLVDKTLKYEIYTKDRMYTIVEDAIVSEVPHFLGRVPIIEYPINMMRMGEFEIVIPLLDCLNETVSDRIDAIDTFIQSILVVTGADMEDNTFANIKAKGGMMLPEGCDVKYLVQELNQSQTQTMVDDLYQTILTICGMPSQADGSTSDSSNNGAVILRNGWYSAEARAKDQEMHFISSEKEFLKIALPLINAKCGTEITVPDVEIRFTRRNYENITQKSNVLIQMLSNDKIHPRLAFEHCGMFADPELAYEMSMEYEKSVMAKEEADINTFIVERTREEENIANGGVTDV